MSGLGSKAEMQADAWLPPGSVLGIVGGGQLGRMTALAAARLGYGVHVLSPKADDPAAQVAPWHTVGTFSDPTAGDFITEERLCAFAAQVDALTYEMEALPVEALRAAAPSECWRPSLDILSICQDRWLEKSKLKALELRTAPTLPVGDEAEFAAALGELGAPGVLKTRCLGYDGIGQVAIKTGDVAELAAAWKAVGGVPSVYERFVDFEYEASVVVARNPQGQTHAYPLVRNLHQNHVLRTTIAPAPAPAKVQAGAAKIAYALAAGLDLVGVLAIEFFVLPSGELWINELAPRPHNSGHWTIEGCTVSQFEQHVRAVMGLPLGCELPLYPVCIMDNILGAQEAAGWHRWLQRPGSSLHLYGKSPSPKETAQSQTQEPRSMRKLGHITHTGHGAAQRWQDLMAEGVALGPYPGSGEGG